jgi:hypothetical protein
LETGVLQQREIFRMTNSRLSGEEAEFFAVHPDRFLFENLPRAGLALAPRLAVAFGSDPNRWESAQEIVTLLGIAPIRRASGIEDWQEGQRPLPPGLSQVSPSVLS